eukprot:SAG22_NODE_208_length_15237_cov_22.602774_11_plen_265_part_00
MLTTGWRIVRWFGSVQVPAGPQDRLRLVRRHLPRDKHCQVSLDPRLQNGHKMPATSPRTPPVARQPACRPERPRPAPLCEFGSGEEVAVKLESVKTKHPQLLYESKLYRLLAGGIGIPNVRWFGVEGEFNILVMDLLGPSLEDLFNFCSRKFRCARRACPRVAGGGGADSRAGRKRAGHRSTVYRGKLTPNRLFVGFCLWCAASRRCSCWLTSSLRGRRTCTRSVSFTATSRCVGWCRGQRPVACAKERLSIARASERARVDFG